MKIIKKTYAEYWGYYWRVTHRHTIPGILQWDIDLINLVEKKCHLHPGMKILDLGCAGGDQAKVFAKRGYRVTGIDSTPNLIEFARSSFQKEGLSAEFIAADMLSIEYKNEFDLCVIFSGTFGFFSDKKNFELLQRIYTALKTKGQVFISYLSLEEMVQMKNEKKLIFLFCS